ncbi:KTSC domain-containing protein [Sphingomonas abietis]|uniref:KTSC domain-containing protein n=1 Tax=Sphingomonas abietis TaxID=3012344 RepID=A0ABY7NTI1_9SPHN|nr:KTSC domain-containing protein [Sphingomonas abietis]WBO23872.1 KTSC domain-containing protein [Sphingomonas abietis]
MIQTFDYDDGEQRLIVRFVSGLVYAYAGVPAEIAAGLREASSKGHYFTESIRDHFPFTRLRGGVDRRALGRGDATLHEER